MNKMTTWALVISALIIGIGIGFFAERQRATNKMEETKLMMQKQIDDTKMMQKDEESGETSMMQKSDVVMMAGSQAHGTHAVATNGMALYTYDKDTKGQSNCTGACAEKWPPYTASGPIPSPLPEHLGTIQRADGTTQYTWDGKPLYYYVSDKDKEDTYGDGVGGVWHLAK